MMIEEETEEGTGRTHLIVHGINAEAPKIIGIGREEAVQEIDRTLPVSDVEAPATTALEREREVVEREAEMILYLRGVMTPTAATTAPTVAPILILTTLQRAITRMMRETAATGDVRAPGAARPLRDRVSSKRREMWTNLAINIITTTTVTTITEARKREMQTMRECERILRQ